MAKAEIIINLTNAGGSDSDKFKPAEPMTGTVLIIPDQDIQVKSVSIRQMWHTEGRGSRHQQLNDEVELFQGKLSRGLPRTFEFDFIAPREPWSYQGHYVSIVWELVVKVDIPMGRDLAASRQFSVQPG